jgi:Fe-Mn family superoxide dismutase
MTDLNSDRRLLLGGMAVAAAALAAAPAIFTPQPLPFDPKAVPGLSEKLLRTHYDNNYVGAVKRLGAIETQLAGLDMATAPGFLLNGLKREELVAWNSMIRRRVALFGVRDMLEG